ncbi:hypothetical protein [Sporosarcina sp. FA9]|uniref:hypothetical protein n=1 Tax=Sporosarcina sp. FA9 TaxID=3413030 RepID=UPI003F6588D4
MYWNYRVLMFNNKQNEPCFEVCEVHYDENHDPYAWAESHNLLVSETLDDLKETYEYMAKAFESPVLKVVENKLVQATE